MAGPVVGGNLRIILGTLGFIVYDHGDRCACGTTFKDTGEDFHGIVFFTRSGKSALPRLASVQILLNICFGEGQTCRTAVNDDTDTFAVGFSPGCDTENIAK